jgi:hypothetical protein
MKNRLKFIALIAFISITGYGQTQNIKFAGGIVYGPKAAFQIFAANGWILDNQAGKNMNLPCVLYLKDYHWNDSPVVMYALIAGTTYETIESFLDFAIKSFKDEDTTFTYKRIKEYKLNNKFEVIVNDYIQKNNSQFDRVAYIQVEKAVCFIVFSTGEKEFFTKYSDDIYSVVASFEYKPEYIKYKK